VSTTLDPVLSAALKAGLAIPASPLALTAQRKLDERRQRALARYYVAAGVGGIAVGVHTTQFAIRDPKHGLYKPVLALAAEEMRRGDARRSDARRSDARRDDARRDDRAARRRRSPRPSLRAGWATTRRW